MNIITFDIDWAPDFMIQNIMDQLEAAGVKSTWFITNDTPALERMRQFPDLYELGIHPNFLPGSSHGSSVDEVLNNLMDLDELYVNELYYSDDGYYFINFSSQNYRI